MDGEPGRSQPIADLRALLRQRRYDEALDVARPLAEEEPRSAEARLLLGVALFRTGDLPAAAEALRAAVTMDPKSRRARHDLAAVLVQLDEVEEAVVLLDELVRADPKDARARVALATAEAKLLTSPPPARTGPDPGTLSARNLIAVLVRPYRFLIAQRGYTGLKAPIVFGLVCWALTQIGRLSADTLWIVSLSLDARQAHYPTEPWSLIPDMWGRDLAWGLMQAALAATILALVLRKLGARGPFAATLRAVAYPWVPCLALCVPAAFIRCGPAWATALASPMSALAGLWMFGLLTMGVAVLHGLHWRRAGLAVLVTYPLLTLAEACVSAVWVCVAMGPQALWSSDPLTQHMARSYFG